MLMGTNIQNSGKLLSEMLVSIIIPVYNTAEYLAEALDSVINQSYKNIEIIIVDDGSTDGSGRICDEYASTDKRIIVFHQRNKGLSAARNYGLEVMKGEAVAFLDSDDAYLADYVNTMVKCLVEEEIDLVVCGYSYQKTSGRMDYISPQKRGPLIRQGRYYHDDALRSLADDLINHGVWNKLYKRKLWEKMRFPEGRVYEEVGTTYRVLNITDSIYVVSDKWLVFK